MLSRTEIFRNCLGKIPRIPPPTPYMTQWWSGVGLLLHFYCWSSFTFPGLCWGHEDWAEKQVYRKAQLSRCSGKDFYTFSLPCTLSIYPLACHKEVVPRYSLRTWLLCVKHYAICFLNFLNPSQIPNSACSYHRESDLVCLITKSKHLASLLYSFLICFVLFCF